MQASDKGKPKTRDVLRMTPWLIAGMALMYVTFDFGLQETRPGLQATIYNLANITLRAWLGYWIARNTLGRLDQFGKGEPMGYVARAIVIGAVVLTSR